MTQKYKVIKIKIDADTGEEISTTIRTSEQDKGYQKMQAASAEYEARGYVTRKQREELGGFTWLIYNTGEMLNLGVAPDTLAKVIFLSTYMDYDNYLTTGNLTRTRERLTRSEVYTLLGVKERKFRDFWNEVRLAGILIEEPNTGWVKLDDGVFHKGSLKGMDVSKKAIRIYANAVRSLYGKSTAREHKLLSYIFQAIPYINIKYNILCKNPEETEIKNVKRLCLTDYCKIIGFDVEHATRLKSALKHLTVTDEGVFGFAETCVGDSVFVNPKVYYGGNNYDEVRIMGKFFKDKDGDVS